MHCMLISQCSDLPLVWWKGFQVGSGAASDVENSTRANLMLFTVTTRSC